MLTTVWFDIAHDEYFVIVKKVSMYIDDLECWKTLILDGPKAGGQDEVYTFELKHNRFKKVG